jgi:hypothetical protein
MRVRGIAFATVILVTVIAATTPAPAVERARGASPVHLLTLNLLHGLFCPESTDACQAPDRVQIFAEDVEHAHCPDLIGLQEIGQRLEPLVLARVKTLCGGRYRVAWAASAMPDRVMVLSSLPIRSRGALDIANVPWEAYWVRVASSQGPIDFLTAHFASSSNDPVCTSALCPPTCRAGIRTNECHGIQVAAFLRGRHGAAMSVVGGDLNAHPDEPAVGHLRDAGFVDTWLASGRHECDASHRDACTSGGHQPEPFVGMNTIEGPGYDERIDYVLARPGPGCTLRASDMLFANTPRATPLHGMYWPADHAGVLAALRCHR